MHRRNMMWGAFSALGAVFAAAATRAKVATDPAPQGKLKVVYHLSDLDKVSFVIGNIENHLDGVGGPDHVTSRWWCTARRCGPFIRPRPTPISSGASAGSQKPGLNLPPAATP